MVILGIDPGSIRIGYGVISADKNLRLIEYGVLEVDKKNSEHQILQIVKQVSDLIEKYRPSLAGIEKIYFTKNVKTGIAVAQTRGAIISEITRRNIPMKEFNPSEIKQAVTNYGQADKKAVAKMVSIILNTEKLTGFDDASDALAIAITAAQDKKWGD